MIAPFQSRMARAALNWTVKDLAERARVGEATIARYERCTVHPIPATLAAIERAFVAAGIEFVRYGVLMKPKAPDAD